LTGPGATRPIACPFDQAAEELFKCRFACCFEQLGGQLELVGFAEHRLGICCATPFALALRDGTRLECFRLRVVVQ